MLMNVLAVAAAIHIVYVPQSRAHYVDVDVIKEEIIFKFPEYILISVNQISDKIVSKTRTYVVNEKYSDNS